MKKAPKNQPEKVVKSAKHRLGKKARQVLAAKRLQHVLDRFRAAVNATDYGIWTGVGEFREQVYNITMIPKPHQVARMLCPNGY